MDPTTETPVLNVEHGDELTHNVKPLLHEIRHALAKWLEDEEPTVIDLRSLPLAPGEEDKLLDTLGHGEVHASLNALGPTDIIETGYAGVWVILHYNSEREVIGKFIEVCDIPDLLRSQQDDIREGLEQLQAELD
jgi:hydrogenase-1 operon protein HyaF